MLPNRLHHYEQAPLNELLAVLLRQFRRPLLTRGVPVSDADADALAAQRGAHERAAEVSAALRDLIAESEAALTTLGLTFPASLDTAMDAIPGWETTADFLEVANEKSNAELRISTGAALLLALGDPAYRRYVEALAARPADDLDGVIARRVLAEGEASKA